MSRRLLVLITLIMTTLLFTAPSVRASGKSTPAKKPAHPVAKKKPARPAAPQLHIVLPPGWPQTFSMPQWGVRNAHIEDVTMNGAGDEKAPFQWNDVAWWDRGPKPGAVGNSVIYGHLDSTCCPAVFYHVRDMRPGDTVEVTYRTGQTLTFRVVWTNEYWNNEVPFGFLYGPNPHRSLSLLTCTGVFHTDGTGYDHKFIVYLRLVMPNGQLG
jgi:hypothetical protein